MHCHTELVKAIRDEGSAVGNEDCISALCSRGLSTAAVIAYYVAAAAAAADDDNDYSSTRCVAVFAGAKKVWSLSSVQSSRVLAETHDQRASYVALRVDESPVKAKRGKSVVKWMPYS